MARMLALFVLVPLVELALLIQLGRLVGLLPTLALIVATGFLGAWLTRRQGLGALAQIQRELGEGRVPAEALVDGILILVAGGVLLTPGLLTDVAGFALLVPATRRRVRAWALQGFERAVRKGRVQVHWDLDLGVRREARAREPEWEERRPPSGELPRGVGRRDPAPRDPGPRDPGPRDPGPRRDGGAS